MKYSSTNGSSKFIVLALVLVIAAAAAYYFLAGKNNDAATDASAPVATEQTAPATEPTPDAASTTTPEAEKPLVVETKTLNVPAAAEPTIPAAAKSSDPAVEAMMGVRKLGSDSAPIKIVEYSSLTCGHCSAFHKNDFPKIKADYIDTGKVQFIFKEFPLNKPALDASKVLRCLPEDKFVAFQTLLFEEQDKWAYETDYLAPLKQNAKLAGLTEAQIDACLNNKDLEARIIGDAKAGTDKFKISSTPTFILNGGAKTIVGHQPMSVFEDDFKAILDAAAPAAPTAAPATPPAEPAPVAPAPVTEASPTTATPAPVASGDAAPAEAVKD